MTKKASEFMGTAIAIAERLDGMLAAAQYRTADHEQCAARLCLTIAEAYSGVLALSESPAQSHAPTLTRTMLEALVNLKNLIADPTFLDQMRFDNAAQQLKTFAGWRDHPDAGIDEEGRRALGRWIAIEQKIYDATCTEERKALGVYGRFERAGMLDSYQTVYRFLCSFSHNNLTTLGVRHGRGPSLRFRQPLPAETFARTMYGAANLYAEAIKTTPAYSNISEADALAAAHWVGVVTSVLLEE
jgi:hypothetical protein